MWDTTWTYPKLNPIASTSFIFLVSIKYLQSSGLVSEVPFLYAAFHCRPRKFCRMIWLSLWITNISGLRSKTSVLAKSFQSRKCEDPANYPFQWAQEKTKLCHVMTYSWKEQNQIQKQKYALSGRGCNSVLNFFCNPTYYTVVPNTYMNLRAIYYLFKPLNPQMTQIHGLLFLIYVTLSVIDVRERQVSNKYREILL